MIEKPNIFLWIFLSPFSLIYRFVIWVRNFLYDYKILKSVEFDIPVISIGNISVGGTGKTPHTEFIISMLKEQNNVAVLSRGYKRKTSGFRLVSENDNYEEVGDEPLQIKTKFPDTIVAVSENRVKGIQQLMNTYDDLNVIILDDAFQHRKLKPGLSILLNDFYHPIAHDHFLPMGRLRESPHAAHRAHIVIVTKCPENMKPIERRIMLKEMQVMPYQHLFFSSLSYLNPKQLFGTKTMELSTLFDYNVLAITGIARSFSFNKELNEMCKSLEHIRYPDHHNFSASNFEKIAQAYQEIPEPRCIIVTEKDAMRIKSHPNFPEFLKQDVWYIPVKVLLLCTEEEELQFNNQILSYVKNNKRYSRLYKNTNLR
jgi:tetraacyldisaccharide 4'-kinase